MSATATAVPSGASDASEATVSLHPDAPTSIAESGLSEDLLTQLTLKQLHFGADSSGVESASYPPTWNQSSRMFRFFARTRMPMALRISPLSVRTVGALVVVASHPLARLPSGMPPRNATM